MGIKRFKGQWHHDVFVDLIRCEERCWQHNSWLCSLTFLMICWRRQRRKRYRRRIQRMAAIRRRLQAFYDEQEEDLREIVAALIANWLICSTMQCQVLWVRNRSQSFTNITTSWDDLEWKRNFCVNRTTFQHLCTELSEKLQHASTVRAAVSVETRVVIALWWLGTNVEYRTISHLFRVSISKACHCLWSMQGNSGCASKKSTLEFQQELRQWT